MSAIILLDTSVYLNVLDVPGFNQNRSSILESFERSIGAGDYFLLPLATVWETGNHIAKLSTGQTRRRYAEKLVDEIAKAFQGTTPYRVTHFPNRDEFLCWLREFPEFVMRSKSPKKQQAGISLADLSLVKEWERTCELNPMTRVRIWSLDEDLACYDYQP